MDSLLANYASSDDEEEQPQRQRSTSSFINAFPQPKTSSYLSSTPQPHINPITEIPIQSKLTSNSNNSSIFSSLPLPKSQNPQPPEKFTKRVVRIIHVIKSNNFDEDDEDEEEKQRKKRKESQHLNQYSSVKSFLSSIPAPKSSATLGVFHSNLGSGRRSIVETETPASSSSGFDAKNEWIAEQDEVSYSSYEMGSDQQAIDYANQYHSTENYAGHEVGSDQNAVDYANHYQKEENYASPGVDSDQNVGNYENYVGYESSVDPYAHSADGSSCVNYGNYNGHGDYWQFESGQEIAGLRVPRKRGKNEIPTEVVEVKQDELMKDRPREDQVKLTGKAFGPSYQAVSRKGKPTKLHKRKHQIGSLYFDMKQKEMELAERRARGLLTKAQTQGKYGW